MSERIYIPLQGPGGHAPKAPSVKGWQSPAFVGFSSPGDPHSGVWFGLRCDGLVVIDCDTTAAAEAWLQHIGEQANHTWVRRTPHGLHFIYAWSPGSPEAPMAGVFEKTDVRAGRTSQIVFQAAGYGDLTRPGEAAIFDPAWLPVRTTRDDAEEWSSVPEGRRNSTLTAIGGALRKQGMAFPEIGTVLSALNRQYCEPPLDTGEIEVIAHSVSRYVPDPDVEFELGTDDDGVEDNDFTDLDARYVSAKMLPPAPPYKWLWRTYLPDARLVLLDGYEGIGKGLFCTWAAVNVASGEGFDEPITPRNVLWYSAEDDPQEDIMRRLNAAGYDAKNHEHVIFLNPRHPASTLTFPADIDHLRACIKRWKPRLVIMDPGRSFLSAPGGTDESNPFNSDAAMRPGLQKLNFLASETGTCILFVHHKSKNGTTSGSLAFRQVVRHILTMAREGMEHAIAVDKSNMGVAAGTVRSYQIASDADTDQAWFVPGGKMPEYVDIAEWVSTQQKLTANTSTAQFVIGYDWQDAALEYKTLVVNAMAPTRAELAKDLGINDAEADQILYAWVVNGLVKDHRWLGLPPGMAS